MTAQISEKLLYNGEKHAMCNEPLSMYFALGGNAPEFAFTCTALWRGYVGSWEIIDDRLYLVNLTGQLKDGTKANLATIFPNYPDRVFAHWYSSNVRIPQGKLLEYVHLGYNSVYEKDLFLYFKNGIVVKTETVENGESTNPDAPEDYGIGGMTVFPSKGADAVGGQS